MSAHPLLPKHVRLLSLEGKLVLVCYNQGDSMGTSTQWKQLNVTKAHIIHDDANKINKNIKNQLVFYNF